MTLVWQVRVATYSCSKSLLSGFGSCLHFHMKPAWATSGRITATLPVSWLGPSELGERQRSAYRVIFKLRWYASAFFFFFRFAYKFDRLSFAWALDWRCLCAPGWIATYPGCSHLFYSFQDEQSALKKSLEEAQMEVVHLKVRSVTSQLCEKSI